MGRCVCQRAWQQQCNAALSLHQAQPVQPVRGAPAHCAAPRMHEPAPEEQVAAGQQAQVCGHQVAAPQDHQVARYQLPQVQYQLLCGCWWEGFVIVAVLPAARMAGSGFPGCCLQAVGPRHAAAAEHACRARGAPGWPVAGCRRTTLARVCSISISRAAATVDFISCMRIAGGQVSMVLH